MGFSSLTRTDFADIHIAAALKAAAIFIVTFNDESYEK